jgi:hypothetical protein
MLKIGVIGIFLMEFLFIQNIHLRGLHVLYFIKRFLPMKLTQFINSPLESIIFFLSNMWTCHNVSWYQNTLFLIGSQILFSWSFDLVLTRRNSNA